MLWKYYIDQLQAITIGKESRFSASVSSTGLTYHCFQHGKKPNDGFSLFISLHGGGAAPASVNDDQYINQKTLYDRHNVIKDSIYCAFRANTDTWDLWHKAYLDSVFTQFNCYSECKFR